GASAGIADVFEPEIADRYRANVSRRPTWADSRSASACSRPPDRPGGHGAAHGFIGGQGRRCAPSSTFSGIVRPGEQSYLDPLEDQLQPSREALVAALARGASARLLLDREPIDVADHRVPPVYGSV